MGIPGAKRRPWYARETWPSIAALALAVVAGATAVVKEAFATEPSVSLLFLYGLGAVAGPSAAILRILQASYKDARDDKKDAPEDLRGCLHVIQRTICGYKGVVSPPDGWLRLTVHRVVGTDLEQVVDYVGSGDRGAGRLLPIAAGLIGASVRDRRPLIFERPRSVDQETWVEYLVHKMAIPRAQAQRTRQDRFAFMSIPIPGPRLDVLAVIYADAAEPGFFDETTQGLLLQGAVGVAHWINEHYYG